MKIRKKKAVFKVEFEVHYVSDKDESIVGGKDYGLNFTRICNQIQTKSLGQSIEFSESHDAIGAMAVVTNVRRISK